MVKQFIDRANSGHPVYISTVYEAFNGLKASEKQVMNLVLTLLENDEKKLFKFSLPLFLNLDQAEVNFVKRYLWAEIYNILSSLGGKEMVIYVDYKNKDLLAMANELNDVFCIRSKRSERQGYGRCINVIDRMLGTLCPSSRGFEFTIRNITNLPNITIKPKQIAFDSATFTQVTGNLDGKVICGMDVGGTDIKIVLVKDGKIDCYKEYDWFPASFKESSQLIDPICLIVRLVRAKISLDKLTDPSDKKAQLVLDVDKALDKSASDVYMLKVVELAEAYLGGKYVEIDAIGLCFPDVVVKDKVVGGEVYKTRGIRNNPEIDYENDFLKLTNLNDRLHELIKADGSVNILNDGPMASFTAAVEIAASSSPRLIEKGVFAHTLGTELGTGWVDGAGNIPDIPLEVYNFIIDLGSFPEMQYASDDLRSINNFNTGLAGTLQKYCSQSGIFRLAMKYIPEMRPDLFKELADKGYVLEMVVDGNPGFYVPTEPKDMRKPFLEHMMALPERENDEVNNTIWREIGEFLAVTWIETKKILNPDTDARFLFGRLVKNKRCFELMKEGAEAITKDIVLEIADASIANTPLMKQLESNPHYTVAQFAQAVGAVYYGNKNS
jgi:hypothetical protein